MNDRIERLIDATEVEVIVTPTDEARRALHGGVSRELLSPAVRAEYDRLLALVMTGPPFDREN